MVDGPPGYRWEEENANVTRELQELCPTRLCGHSKCRATRREGNDFRREVRIGHCTALPRQQYDRVPVGSVKVFRSGGNAPPSRPNGKAVTPARKSICSAALAVLAAPQSRIAVANTVAVRFVIACFPLKMMLMVRRLYWKPVGQVRVPRRTRCLFS